MERGRGALISEHVGEEQPVPMGVGEVAEHKKTGNREGKTPENMKSRRRKREQLEIVTPETRKT